MIPPLMRLAWALALLGPQLGIAQSAEPAQTPPNSALDAPLFYEVLIGEIEFNQGHTGTAYGAILDAARRSQDPALFRRAIEIALQGRAGEQALEAAKAWRSAQPNSPQALRSVVQLLLALNRAADAAEPLRSLLETTAESDRSALISALPPFFQHSTDKKRAVATLEQVLRPYQETPTTRTASRVALGQAELAAGNARRALTLAQQAHADDPQATAPVALALDLLRNTPEAENIVTGHLQTPGASLALRLGYARALALRQRYAEAIGQLEAVTQAQPQWPAPWLSLGALRLELKQARPAQEALLRYAEITQSTTAPKDTESGDGETPDEGLTQAWLLLAQTAEQLGDFKGAEDWLARIDSPERLFEVQARRASLLVRQGQVEPARQLLRSLPTHNTQEERAKFGVEVQLLSDAKRWQDAQAVLAEARRRFPEDSDLIYEEAMVEERLGNFDRMEKLLRHIIEVKPDYQHAYNALGYALADRNQRLPEAKQLIEKALQLVPGEPFITDSLGWVEYRLGRHDEALQLLRKAYASRPDIEIAVHLAEVLWFSGQQDEARRLLRDIRQRDADNELLKELLGRLKVDL